MKKMKFLLLFIALFSFKTSFCQDYTNDITTTDITKVIDLVDFKPIGNLKNASIKIIKTVILQSSDSNLKQMNIDSWYYCANKHEETYQIWNLNYKKIDKNFFNKYCKELTVLMILDGVIITAK